MEVLGYCAIALFFGFLYGQAYRKRKYEVVGYLDEYGNFEQDYMQWMEDEPDVEWVEVYELRA